MGQTTIQNIKYVRFQSAKVQIALYSDGIGSLIDLGLCRNIEVAIESNGIDLKGNIDLRKVEAPPTAKVTFEYQEPDLERLHKLNGAEISAYTSVAAAPVAITDELVTLTGTTSKRLTYKDGDNTEVGSIVVTTYAGGALSRNTDYVISVDSGGYTTIARIAGAGIGDGDIVKVDYSYTPLASKNLTFGSAYSEIKPLVMRFTNTNVSSKVLRLDLYKVFYNPGKKFSFKDDGSNEISCVMPIECTAVCDFTRTNLDLLGCLDDQQGA